MPAKLKSRLVPWLLIPAILSLFWPALLHPSFVLFPTFSPFSDVMVIHWPKVRLMAENWQANQGLPYWTPLILSGMPLVANQLGMTFYPPAWLFLLWPIEPVFNLLFVFHLFLGGIGIYLLLHERYNLSTVAALLGGLTFALSGKIVAHVAGGHVSMVGAIAWLPWTVFGWQMWLRDEAAKRQSFSPSGLRWIILIAVSLAMQLVTHTLPVIYSVYLMAAMAIWQVASQRKNETAGLAACLRGGLPPHERRAQGPTLQGFSDRLLEMTNHSISDRTLPLWRFKPHFRSFVYMFVALTLAGLLGAAQLFPLLELAQYSNRSLNLEEATAFALSPLQLLVGLLLPSIEAGHEHIIYVGLIPLLLAPFGLTRRNRWVWFYGLLFIFAILFSLGPNNPLHSLFYYFAPGFRWVRTPARIFFVAALAIAVLVGFGADQLSQIYRSSLAKKWLSRLTVALVPLTLSVGGWLAFRFGPAAPIFRPALALAIFIPVGLILFQAQRFISRQLALTLLGLLLFLDLAWFDASMLRFVSPEEALSPGRAAAMYLAQQPGYFRVYSPSYSLPTQTAAAAGLSLADGVEPVHLAVYDEYMAQAGGYKNAGFNVTIPRFGDGPLETSLKEVEPNLKLLGLLNVAYLASAFSMNWPGLNLEKEIEGVYIYRNKSALPRAWVAHQTIPSKADWLTQLQAMPDITNIALVENPTAELSTSNVPHSTATIISYTANRIKIETNIRRPGWLVLSEIWYPGWRATVNGEPQPVEKVDGLLRGLYLSEAGQYQIELEYRPQSVIWGGWISGITTGLLILAAVYVFIRRG